jgi:hypothetical protein
MNRANGIVPNIAPFSGADLGKPLGVFPRPRYTYDPPGPPAPADEAPRGYQQSQPTGHSGKPIPPISSPTGGF